LSNTFMIINGFLKKHFGYPGSALGMSLIFTVALGMIVSSGLYFADQTTRDDAKRLLLLQANQALKVILTYETAALKNTDFNELTSGSVELSSPLVSLLENTFQMVDPNDCELFITQPTAFKTLYIDPNDPANRNHPFAGQTLSQSTYTICAKAVAKQPNNGPSMTVCGRIPITQINFSYFNFTAFFDVDLDLSCNNWLTIDPLIYSKGSIWSSAPIRTKAFGLMCGGQFRQTQPSLFSNTSAINGVCTVNMMSSYQLGGATLFDTYTLDYPYDTYNSLDNKPVNPSSSVNENDFYDSLTTNAQSTTYPNIKSWDDFLNTYNIHFSTEIDPFPIDGYAHYIPSNPRVASDNSGRNSKNYAWALLEPPFGPGSYWHKGDGEKNKFSTNSCAVIKVITSPAPNIDSTWGLPILSTNSHPIAYTTISNSNPGASATSRDKCPIPTPTRYEVHYVSFDREDNNNPFSPIISNNNGSASLNPLGNHGSFGALDNYISGSSLIISVGEYPNPFALMAPYKLSNNAVVSSFYDPRRQCGIDALFVDVSKLYEQLTSNSYDNSLYFPSWKPDQQYNGIVYIEFPESKFNNMPQDGSAGTVCPPSDSNYIRKEGNTPVAWGVVLVNGNTVPLEGGLGALGLTIATNVPVYIYTNTVNPTKIYGSGNAPCMIAADSVTVLSPGFFERSTAMRSLLYNPSTTLKSVANMSTSDSYIYSSILTGITAYWPTSNWNGIGDNLSTSLRIIEDASSSSTTLNIVGTVFGLTEPQCACGPLKNCNPFNYARFHYAGSSELPCVQSDPKNFIPPGCQFLKNRYYRSGACTFMTEADFDAMAYD
jgi:hypothetical protein